MRIVITGISGFIGNYLAEEFMSQGHEVIAISRKKNDRYKTISWEEDDFSILENIDFLVHLAGESVAKGYWTQKKKDRIYHSRIDTTQKLVEILLKLKNPPKKVFCTSAMGFYGKGNQLTEESSAGKTFLAQVCSDWEKAAQPLVDAGIPVVWMRLGHVMHASGGFLKPLIFMTKAFFGNIWGTGNQKISWISLQDLINAILFCYDKDLSGPINFTTPQPISQKEMMYQLGAIFHRRIWLVLPEKFLQMLLGEMAKELFLVNLEVFPKKLQSHQYSFLYPGFSDFLKTLEK